MVSEPSNGFHHSNNFSHNKTLLHIAARHGHDDVVEFLLDECRERNLKMLEMVNEAKDAALHEAVRCGYVDVVRLLVKEDRTLLYGMNKDAETPLHLAAERGYGDVVKKILENCDSPDEDDPYGRTALHAAVISYHYFKKGSFCEGCSYNWDGLD